MSKRLTQNLANIKARRLCQPTSLHGIHFHQTLLFHQHPWYERWVVDPPKF